MTDEQEQQRREFFRDGLARLMGPASDYLDRKFGLSEKRTLLRPPGALKESEFLETCHRCGSCVEACPAKAIFAWSSGDSKTEGTPVIDADAAACVVCEGLDCMGVCPSGALLQVESRELIDMGLAEVSAEQCVRSQGEVCTICLERCPLGDTALVMAGDGPPRVLEAGCVGCGVCQLYCPTRPRAIVVIPSHPFS